MHSISLRVSKKNKPWLIDYAIDICFIQHMLSLTINLLRPTNRNTTHVIKLAFVDDDFSMYTFENTLHISKSVFNQRARYKLLDNVFNHIMHEFAHYIQFNVDRVGFNNFAVDHEKMSYTRYINNLTERQARVYGNIASKFTQLYLKLNKVKLYTKPLNNTHGTKEV